MSKFVVSYISFFDNDLQSCVVESNSEVHAFLQGVYELQCRSADRVPGLFVEDEFLASLVSSTVDQIKSQLFDCDAAANIIQVL